MTALPAQVEKGTLSAAELADLMRAYQQATERLQAAHGQLQREVARLRAELAETNAELARKERLAALGQMAAGVAHEVRNPLGAIRLFAGMLRRGLDAVASGAPADEARRLLDYTDKILRAVSSMDGIVEGMLSLARTRAPTLVPCDLGAVIEGALEAAAADLERHRITVTRRGPRGVSVRADADQLHRAFLNVIVNAAQAMGDGGRLRVAVTCGNGRVRVQFTDTGPGIDPQHLERIFEPFFTGREGGTGLGLALVDRIVEGHKGRLWARNEPAGGATFVIELPTLKDSDHGPE